MKRKNFSIGKYYQNGEKAIERRLSKKLDGLIFIGNTFKNQQLKRKYTHPQRLRIY